MGKQFLKDISWLKTVQPVVCILLLLIERVSSTSNYLTCPSIGRSMVIPTHDIISTGSSPSGRIALRNSYASGDLCTLTLQDSSTKPVSIPVARSYDGRNWEITAGSLSEVLPSPTCESSICTLVDLPPPDTARKQMYVLMSYSYPRITAEAEAARFLEQATFGPTHETINALASKSGEKYKEWVKDQIEVVPMSSHREHYRRYLNPRVEYPFKSVAPGPKTACHQKSRWRMFAISQRDGIRSTQSSIAKYLYIKARNGRYVWYLEGRAITTTSERPKLYTEKGYFIEDVDMYPTLYSIHFVENERYSCIDCLINVNKRYDGDGRNGYIRNPKVDLTDIANDSSLVPHTIVSLPQLGSGMTSIDNGEEFQESVYFSQFNKPNDEFWLSDASSVNIAQCSDHPDVYTAAYDTPSLLNTGNTPDVNEGNHPETVFPPLFGKAFNPASGKTEYLIFDPHVHIQENTIENPLSDGGGLLQYETDGYTWCANAPRSFMNEDHCKISFSEYACTDYVFDGLQNPENDGVVVCGSLGEVANEMLHGSTNSYDTPNEASKALNFNIYKGHIYAEYRNTIWANHALFDEGQLRQRMAWALYQIIPIGHPDTTGNTGTEIWLQYYDIFVRNAFGSYGDILKQISYTDAMGVWLSFYDNASLQYNIDKDGVEKHPDENYAREIMQLFSIGVWQLNMDGSKKLDENGVPLNSYDGNDIMNIAKAWTGLSRNYRNRGNTESSTWGPFIDPMFINRGLRDIFPKTDLLGGYIGDQYPLCADLPVKDHLKRGATYRLLGSKSLPELQLDLHHWETNENILRLELESSSPLYDKLCAADNSGSCTFPGKVVLDENLLYETQIVRSGKEFNVDTVRTVRIAFGSKYIYYEYIRMACVDQVFLGSDAKKVIRGNIGSDSIIGASVCADPKRDVATELCCNQGWETSTEYIDQYAHRFCTYHAERMSYEFASDRCAAEGKEQCSPRRFVGSICNTNINWGYWGSWTAGSCMTRAKISFENGLIGRVDYPDADYAGHREVTPLVHESTRNFFNVAWFSEPNLPTESTSCDAIETCYSVEDGCVCDTSVTESTVFEAAGEISSKDALLGSLHIGFFAPDIFDADDIISLGNCNIDGVEVYSRSPSDSCSNLGTRAFFGLVDNHGVQRYLRNMMSTVQIPGLGVSFRNPPQFINMVDQDRRDMYYETDAVIEHFFHHPSHPPFLAIRMLQRFGISNPSPGYIERVATAYLNGSYNGIGSGTYGNLGAMIAAILLDDESRSVTIDADPSHGHLREPIIKVTSFLRSMEAKYTSPLSWVKFSNLGIGQEPYKAPSVFSFFLPEYAPPGVIEKANLVSPESQVLTANYVTTLIDGFFSTVKFGLVSCHNGFGDTVNTGGCPEEEGNTDDASGYLGYTFPQGASVNQAIDDLSLVLTAGRLGDTNKAIIREAIENEFETGDKAKATRIAQQLMLSTPEFHSWGSIHTNNGVAREIKGYTKAPNTSYKSIVFFSMSGGVDSFNLVVPKDNCSPKDMYEEYKKARQGHAIPKDNLLDINAIGSDHFCDTWGVNEHFPILKELYDKGEGMFFLNTGVLSKPLTKHDDYITEANIRLFAHNHMEREQLANDPHYKNTGTGVGGRLLDILKRNGFQTSGNTVNGDSLLNIGDSYYGNPTSTVVTGEFSYIDKHSTLGPNNEMLGLLKKLNGVGGESNSMFGETWSNRLSKVLFEYDTAIKIDEAVNNGDFDMNGYPNRSSEPSEQLRAAAKYIKSRHVRKVDREVYHVHQGGYDMHGGQSGLVTRFNEANEALSDFIEEMKRQGLWEDTVIIMNSEFGRTITPNSNGGTDHAWGGNYFMLGGGLKGGKLMGEYPEHLSENGDYWVRRGRIIPTTPWDSIWYGVSEWMGVQGDDDLSFVLPNSENFDKCSKMFRAHDLFKNVPSRPCIDDADGDGVPDDIDECPNTAYWIDSPIDSVGCQEEWSHAPSIVSNAPSPLPSSKPPPSILYEAEDPANTIQYGSISNGHEGYTGTGYVNMGGKNSYVEWPEVNGGSGGACTLTFRYALATSGDSPRESMIMINDQDVGLVTFDAVGDSWGDYGIDKLLGVYCPSGSLKIRLTAVTSNGGPNLDNMEVSIYQPDTSSSPTLSVTLMPSDYPTQTDESSLAPTNFISQIPTVSYAPTNFVSQIPTVSQMPSEEPSFSTVPVWNMISYDDFENGWGTFIAGGNDAKRYTMGHKKKARKSQASLFIRDNTGNKSSIKSNDLINVSSYTKLKVEFFYNIHNFRKNEEFMLEYKEGASEWILVKTWVFGQNVSTLKKWYKATPTITTTSMNEIKIRFRCNASSNRDKVYLDNIVISGWG